MYMVQFDKMKKQAEAEVVPSSSLIEVVVEVEVGVDVGVEVEVGVELEATFTGGWVKWCGEVKTRANLSQV